MADTKLFIAYARDDDPEFVTQLQTDLTAYGYNIQNVEDLMDKSSAEVSLELRQRIAEIDQLVLVIGPRARTSAIVRWAWQYAWQYCKLIIPVLRLDANLQLPQTLQGVDYVDFRNNRRYEFARDELVSILETPLAPVGEIHDVPALPRYYLAREDSLETVKEALFNDTAPVTITNTAGGTGKSVLASAIARDCEVRQAAADGVFWLRLGKSPNIPLLQSSLLEMLKGSDSTPCVDEEQGKSALQVAFEGRSALIILDDVHEPDHVRAFRIFGSQIGLLITTRNPTLSNAINSADYNLPELSDEEAARLLAMVSGQKLKSLPAMTLDIIRAVNANPMALTILGATVKLKTSGWGMVLHRLRNNKADNVVANAIQTALDTPSEGTSILAYKERYPDLTIFPPYVPINLALLQRLWGNDASLILAKLAEKELLERDEEGNVYLHVLHHDYLQAYVQDARAIHRRFLDSYQPVKWAEVRDDRYIYQHLHHHMHQAGRADVFRHLLLNFEWIHAKLQSTNINALLSDYEYALSVHQDASLSTREMQSVMDDLRLLRDALQLSAEVLAGDKDQLVPQLLARLLDQDSTQIQRLLDTAIKASNGIWLRPITQSLTEPRPRGRSSLNVSTGLFSQALAVTPDQKHALIASRRNMIQIWNLETGARERTLTLHTGMVWALAVSPDGKRFVSGSEDYTAIIWDFETGEPIHILRGHMAPIWAVAFSPDSRTIATGSVDKSIKLWDAESGLNSRTLAGHMAEVADVCFSPNGTYVLSASYDRTVRAWFMDGTIWKTFTGHDHQVNAVAITSDNLTVISASRDKTIRLWNIATGQQTGLLIGHSEAIRSIAVGEDPRYLVSASRDRSIKVWDIQQKHELRTIAENQGSVMAVRIVGDQIVMSSQDVPLKMWELISGNETLSLDAHTLRIDSLKALPEKPQIITGSLDQTVKLWHVETGAVLRTFRAHRAGVDSLALTDNGQYVVSGSYDNTLNIFSLNDGVLTHTLKAHLEGITATVTTPDRQYVIAASADNTVTIWDIVTGDRLQMLRGHTAPITALAVTPDSRTMISASLDHTLMVWDIHSGEQRYVLKGHTDGVTGVAATADGQCVLSTSRDQTILLWDLGSGDIKCHYTGHTAWINALALTENGFVTASDDMTIKVWSLEQDAPLRSLEGHRHWVWDVVRSGDHLFSVSSDSTLRMWNLTTGENIATFTADSPLIACTLSSDGKTIVAGAQSGHLHLLRIEGMAKPEVVS